MSINTQLLLRVVQVEQFWIIHPQELDREIFAYCPFVKIGSLENLQLYGTLLSSHELNA